MTPLSNPPRLPFVFASAMLVLAAAASAQDEAANTADEEKTAKTHEVKSGPLKIELTLTGSFESANSAEISLRPEEWAKIEVKEAKPHGARVKKGDVLVVVDTQDLRKAIRAAKQDLVLSELGLQEAKLGLAALKVTNPIDLAAAERSVQEAEADLKYFLDVTKDRSQKSAKNSLRSAQYSLEYAQEELNQLRQMYKADDLTEESEEIILKRAERSVISAQFYLESQELRTKRTLETDLPRQEKQLVDSTKKQVTGLARTKATVGSAVKKAEIALEKQVIAHEAAEKKLNDLLKDLERLSSVTSPIDGYVFYGRVKKGAWAGKGTLESSLQPGGTIPAKSVFMTVVSAGVSRFHTTVKEKDVFHVKKGLAGTAKATALPNAKLTSQVDSISLVPSSPGSFECVLAIGGAADSLLSGMKGDAKITIYEKAKALTVPKSAVFSEDDKEVVYVVDGDGHKKATVKTGREKGSSIEIVEGLSAGDRILGSKP